MKIHKDPVSQNLARLFGHTKDYDRSSGFQKNIKIACQKVEEKYGRKIDNHVVINWMIDGPSHRYPSPDLLALIADVLGVDEVWDLWVTYDKWIKIDNINPLRVEIYRLLSRMDNERLKALLGVIKFALPPRSQQEENFLKEIDDIDFDQTGK